MNSTDTFMALATERYSCRNYRSDMPDAATINRLLEAARLAPSACNRQPWRFAVVSAADTEAYAAVTASYGRQWLQTAPVFIIVCGVAQQAWTRPADNHSHLDIDIAIATEHICLEATAAGLATCWVCNFDPAVLKAGLSFPEGVEPMVILPVGYAADAETPQKNRHPLSDLIINL